MVTKKILIRQSKAIQEESKLTISLPKPDYSGPVSIEEALSKRRSVRDYKNEALQLKEISQLLWAAQGITGEDGKRTAPSAGAFYPLEIYLVAATVEGLVPGIYHYRPTDHSLEKIAEGDKRKPLSAAALMQGSVRHCAAIIAFAAHFSRITKKYFERGKYYGYLETGHAAQNILLQSIPLHIGAVTVGAFVEGVTKKILHLPENEKPLYMLPLGKI